MSHRGNFGTSQRHGTVNATGGTMTATKIAVMMFKATFYKGGT